MTISIKNILIGLIIIAAGFVLYLNMGGSGGDALPESQAALIMFNNCKDSSRSGGLETETCYYKEFISLAEEKGSEFSFKTLTALQQLDNSAIGCHLLSHGIGTGSYRKNPGNWQELIRDINSTCSYGAPHGVIEEHLSTSGQRMTKEFIPQICGPQPRADCNHIVGHLLLVETEANVDKALVLCDVFKDDRQNEFCLLGVFMEYQTALNLINHGYAPESWKNWPARLPELEKMCRSYDGKNAIACWEEIVHVALMKFKNDPEKIFNFCDLSPIADAAIKCRRHSIGIMATAKKFDLESMKPICKIMQQVNLDFEADCYIQLVASAMSTLPDFSERAYRFCNGLDEEFTGKCSNYVGGAGGR